MLILSRKAGEELVINRGVNSVVIRVVRLTSGRVRLGITADPSVPIRRAELEDLGNGSPVDDSAGHAESAGD